MSKKLFRALSKKCSVFILSKENFFMAHSFVSDSRCQISVELIILLAAVVAIVLILVSQLQETGTKGAEKIKQKTEDIFSEIDKIK